MRLETEEIAVGEHTFIQQCFVRNSLNRGKVILKSFKKYLDKVGRVTIFSRILVKS